MAEIDPKKVYSSFGQKVARALHFLKVKYRNKEKNNILLFSENFKKESTIFDIGANLGHFSKEFCKVYNSSCKVYSFEPVSYNFTILRNVVKDYTNIIIENIALSNDNGKDFIFIPVKESGKIGNGLAHLGAEDKRDFIKEEIILKKMDDYVEEMGIEKIDFIKCDVEGAELLVFQGGEDSIKKFNPNIYCEIDHNMTKRLGYHPSDFWRFFEKIGYKFYLYDHHGKVFNPVEEYKEPGDYFIFPEEYKFIL